MILKCSLIEAAVDTVTMITAAPSTTLRFTFHWALSGVQHGKVSRKCNLAEAKEICRFVFIGTGGEKSPKSLTNSNRAVKCFLLLHIQRHFFPCFKFLLPKS